ncbi:MAG: hypothetical protein OHK0029_25890 [Armatimonadaceae bacterium]
MITGQNTPMMMTTSQRRRIAQILALVLLALHTWGEVVHYRLHCVPESDTGSHVVRAEEGAHYSHPYAALVAPDDCPLCIANSSPALLTLLTAITLLLLALTRRTMLAIRERLLASCPVFTASRAPPALV